MRLFEGIRDREHFGFAKGFADDLQANRQTTFGEAAGHGNRWQASEIDRDGVDVAQIHGEWIIGALTALERGCRRGRCKDRIDLLKGGLEVAKN